MEFQESGRLKLVGIVQEQHSDRANLFMQWKEMDWPLMFDPLNQLNVDAVPITLLIDEGGIVRAKNPSQDELIEFLESEFELPEFDSKPVVTKPDLERARRRARQEDPGAEIADADTLVLWGNSQDLSLAISLLERFLESDSENGPAEFRAGVAFRRRFDSDERHAGDFQSAISHWTRALEINPNQYIWRRRIQQYGPRLQKPYAFFDWVDQARVDIRARGQEPHSLRVEPRGAELASPTDPPESLGVAQNPDPKNRIFRDQKGYVLGEYTLVPGTAKRGQAVRVHLELRPNASLKAHWNNEVSGLVFFASPNPFASIDKPYQKLTLPVSAVSTETRVIELEVEISNEAPNLVELETFALYYVCEDKNGKCLYRRLDMPISINVK